MDPHLHRIEVLPGQARYAVTFRLAGGGEQNTTVEVRDGTLRAAPAGLPPGWSAGSPQLSELETAVIALERARSFASAAGVLHDVAGGWDVSLGNVVLIDGAPACIAHGAMGGSDPFVCAECDARAVLGA